MKIPVLRFLDKIFVAGLGTWIRIGKIIKLWKYFLSTEFWPRCTNKSDYIDDEDDGEGDDDDGDDGEGDGPDVAVPVNRITPQLSCPSIAPE